MLMSKIYVQPLVHETFSDFVDFADKNQFNLEIATFAYANVYEADWPKILNDHAEKLSALKGKISFHGVFQDVLIHSSDKKIAELSKERVLDNLEVARKLNATQVVFHGNFNPFVKDNYYRKNWVERNAVFWREVLEKYNFTILLENTWEPAPDMFNELLDEVKSSRLKVCFDIGHLNVYSKKTFCEWADALGKKISYVHISDNCGEKDQHLEVGQGKIDWQEFTNVIKEHQISPEIVLEQVTIDKTKQSLSYLEKNQIYPFNHDLK
jgi:sugar phosphate isomerase/epimerase